MNETQKTGIFWGVALVVAIFAAVIAWPRSTEESMGTTAEIIGEPLFPDFKDPLAAASLKIVTFNEVQGELKSFEVRKDPESGLWTIPSKGGYPADAIEQMRDAANALVALSILDLPTSAPEDHEGMGVVEPKLDDLDPGDEGVGRLVTLKDEAQNILASVIVGREVKGQEGQVYVRKPGQDPVYVVKLDDQPLSTKFGDWIEEDLLQLSSIDIEEVVVKDYNASLGLQGVSLSRNYEVELEKEGTQWSLSALKEYDKENPLAEPKIVETDPEKELNSQKLNDLANALDDLKFVDVKRKPDGISANLKADQEFASDNEAAGQLARRGFIPVPMGPNREIEILSANGELTATTANGVKYILRFGDISGISEDDSDGGEDAADDAAGGVNRYLMVSTVVDESKFPVPDLTPIPQTLEDLETLDKQAVPEGVELPPELNPTDPETNPAPETTDVENATPDADGAAEQTPAESSGESDSGPKSEEASIPDSDKSTTSEPSTAEPSTAEPGSGETEVSGEGSSSTVGEGQEPVSAADQAGSDDADASAEASAGEEKDSDAGSSTEPTASSEAPDGDATEKASGEPAETEGEKLERLAAVQEKITKENERRLETRKENLEQARIESKKLNERFADWYYVIPEATYSKLRVSREELFDTSGGAAMPNPAGGPQFPNFQFPGAPAN